MGDAARTAEAPVDAGTAGGAAANGPGLGTVSELARASSGAGEHASGKEEAYNEEDGMPQVKALFYVPLKDNDGRSLRTEIEALRAELFIRFLAWSFLGYVTGAYRMADGTQALDVNASYMVVLDEALIPELEEVLREFKSQTLQEAIYLEVQRNVEVRLI
jgi:hypothetical protein